MRVSPLHDQLANLGAEFGEQEGREIVTRFADHRTEYAAIREAVGLTDFSFVQKFRVPEAEGLDFLDQLVAGNVPRIRFGRVLHTFLADDDGHVIADCFVANNDEELLFLCESIVPDARIQELFQAHGMETAGVSDWTDTHVVLSIDGVRAWEPVRELFGSDVLGLPYLSVEVYPFEGESVYLFRAGKTAEFGYLVLAPRGVAPALFTKLHDLVQQAGGRCCGMPIHQDLRIEGRFFNIYAEGQQVRDPLVLGLQWMIDFEKDDFPGAAAIKQRRASGLSTKQVGVAAAAGREEFITGTKIFHEGRAVGELVAHCHSYQLNQRIGLAVLPVELAYAGLAFPLGAPDAAPLRTISMPPIMPQSLKVKLDEV